MHLFPTSSAGDLKITENEKTRMKVPNGRAILPLSSNCRCEASQDKLPSHEHDHSTESNIYWRREIQFVIHFCVFSRALLDALSCQRPLLFHPHPPNVSAGSAGVFSISMLSCPDTCMPALFTVNSQSSSSRYVSVTSTDGRTGNREKNSEEKIGV